MRVNRTDDSDQMILIMETILELNGSVDEHRYAAKLKVLFTHRTRPHTLVRGVWCL